MSIPSIVDIASAIKDELERRTKNVWETHPDGISDTSWTQDVIKPTLIQAGNDCGYYTCANKVGGEVEPAYSSEWLYDVCWIDYGKKIADASEFDTSLEREFKRMVLVAESEWGNDEDVLDDFEKLLQAHAAVKVMVFDEGKAPSSIRRLQRIISDQNQSHKNEQYLLIQYLRNDAHTFEMVSMPKISDFDIIF